MKNLFISLALIIVVMGLYVGIHGHFWIGIGADFAGICVAVGGRYLSKRLARGRQTRKPD